MNGQNINNNADFRSSRSLTGNEAAARGKKRYKYICYDRNGKQVKGSFDAFRRMDVESFLLSQGYKILEISNLTSIIDKELLFK